MAHANTINLVTGAFSVVAATLVFSPSKLAAQGPTLKYDVVSIKSTNPGDSRRPGMEFLPGGRFRAVKTPFFQVLATAFDIPWQSIEVFQARVKGTPDWMFRDGYDLEAKVEHAEATPSSAKPRRERDRLQWLLTDRLKLKIRREPSQTQGYALVSRKSGVKLAKSAIPQQDCSENVPFAPMTQGGPRCHQIQGGTGRGIHGTAIDMSDLALFLSNWSDRPIVDESRLTGLYAIDTEGWSPAGDDPSRPRLDEILERIGLRLVRKAVAIETIIIEHVERPADN